MGGLSEGGKWEAKEQKDRQTDKQTARDLLGDGTLGIHIVRYRELIDQIFDGGPCGRLAARATETETQTEMRRTQDVVGEQWVHSGT